jgi:hypothetical protein
MSSYPDSLYHHQKLVLLICLGCAKFCLLTRLVRYPKIYKSENGQNNTESCTVLKVYFVGKEVNFFIKAIDFLIHAFENFQSFIIQKRTSKNLHIYIQDFYLDCFCSFSLNSSLLQNVN